MDERGPWTGHLTKPAQVCYCADGWICEKHPEQGWPHASAEERRPVRRARYAVSEVSKPG
jgi:hypothetical protein